MVTKVLDLLFTLSLLGAKDYVIPAMFGAGGARRLHDIDKSGWFQLLYLIPVIGGIILIYWAAQEGKEPNRF